MADNVTIPATGSGTATPAIATDDVGSVHFQKIKLDGGGDGVSVPIVAGQQLAAGSVPVVLTAAQITTLTPVAALTDTQLRATAVPVSGTVTATGPLTDTQLRATAVPVSGPLTDTQLRATAVPVSGTVTTGGLTDTQLRATAVPVSLATVPSHAVTNAGTFAVQNTAATPAGSNNIGDVDVLTLPALAAGSALIGSVTITKSALTAAAPAASTVGTSSAQALAANASRRGHVVVNTSANNISIGLGATAVLLSGITLTPNGAWTMDDYSFTTAAINAIASAASSNLAIQEYT